MLVCDIFGHENKDHGLFSKALNIGQHCPECLYLWNHGLQVDIGAMEEIPDGE